MLQVAGQATVLGTERHWALMLSLSLIPALTQFLLLPLCPKSPPYLLLTRAEESKAAAGGSEPGFSCHRISFQVGGRLPEGGSLQDDAVTRQRCSG